MAYLVILGIAFLVVGAAGIFGMARATIMHDPKLFMQIFVSMWGAIALISLLTFAV